MAKYIFLSEKCFSNNVKKLGLCNLFPFISTQGSFFHTYPNLEKRNHYDILGISSKSSQAEIKKAYYKLSLKHHPDSKQNKNESSSSFIELTEAYEILNDPIKRKQYDNTINYSKTVTMEETNEFGENFEKYKIFRKRNRYMYSGKTQYYDFDAWTRAHYQDNFERAQSMKRHAQFKKFNERQNKLYNKSDLNISEKFTIIFFGFTLLIYAIISNLSEDKNKLKSNNNSNIR